MESTAPPIPIAFHGGQRVMCRRASPADLSPICDWTDAHLQGDYFFRRGHLAQILRNPKNATWAIEVDEQMAGLVILYDGSRLHNLYIAPAFRGTGIGTAVIEHFRPRVIRAKTNMRAGDPVPFYQRCGYEVTAADPNRPWILEMTDMTAFTRPQAPAPVRTTAPAPAPAPPATERQPPTSMLIAGDALKAFVKFCRWQLASLRKREEQKAIRKRIAAEYAAQHLQDAGLNGQAAASPAPLPEGAIGSIEEVLAAWTQDDPRAGGV